MKTKIIIMTEPKSWSFTDQQTGAFRSGISAIGFLPGEGVLQSFSNLPAGTQQNYSYVADVGFTQKTSNTGKYESTLKLVSLDLSTGKSLNWDSFVK